MQHIPSLRSTLDSLRDRFAPVRHTSTFRKTGEITPEEFILAGDYLVAKFPSWSWASAGSGARQVNYFPREKQYLVTKHVPCNRRVNGDDFVGGEEKLVFLGAGKDGEGDGDEWVSTGGGKEGQNSGSATIPPTSTARATAAMSQQVGIHVEEEEEEEIPDMDASDDEAAVIREQPGSSSGGNNSVRTYNLYITYTPYYRTPRLYLSGFNAQHTPLPPSLMLEDIVGDYSEKTVTLEDFPFFDAPIKMASVHPCRHAAVMKILLERADAAVKLRRERERQKDDRENAKDAEREKAAVAAGVASAGPGLEGLVEGVSSLDVSGAKGSGQHGSDKEREKDKDGDEWEVLPAEGGVGAEDDEEAAAAIQVHQYIVVFLKFMASVTPGIEHDFTMGV